MTGCDWESSNIAPVFPPVTLHLAWGVISLIVQTPDLRGFHLGFLCQVGLCVLASPLPSCCSFLLLPRWLDATDDPTGHSASAGLLVVFEQLGELIELAFTSSWVEQESQGCRPAGKVGCLWGRVHLGMW